MASGINVAALPGAVAFGDTPASTPETVSFILRERNVTLLELAAETGSKNYLGNINAHATTGASNEPNFSILHILFFICYNR